MARPFCDARAAIGETPVWLGQYALWTDPVSRTLLRAGDSDAAEVLPTDAAVWGIAARGDQLVGTLNDRLAIVGSNGTLRAGPGAALDPGCRFNDLAVAASGAIWAGVMHRGLLATRGALYRAASPDAVPQRVAGGLGVPNGMKLSADGRTLLVVDTLARTLLVYPVAGAALGEPVVLTDFMNVPGKPDGMAIDARGHLFVAMWGGGCVAEIAPDGVTIRTLPVAAPHVSSACLTTDGILLVSTSRMRLSADALAAAPLSGALFAIDPGAAA